MKPDKQIPLHRQLAWQSLRNQVDACSSLEQLKMICRAVIDHGITQEAATQVLCGRALLKQEVVTETSFPTVPRVL